MKNPNHEDSNNVVQRIGMHEKSLALFENYKIRRHYDDHTETWYFSVVDIIAVLLQQPDYQTARKYWNKLKGRMKKEGSQSVTNCHQLKLEAADGKKYLTDAADPETLLRIIQSVPSPKAEPVKLWLAKEKPSRVRPSFFTRFIHSSRPEAVWFVYSVL